MRNWRSSPEVGSALSVRVIEECLNEKSTPEKDRREVQSYRGGTGKAPARSLRKQGACSMMQQGWPCAR